MHIGVVSVLVAAVATLLYFDQSDPRNWDGQHSLSTPDVHRPSSTAEVASLVRSVYEIGGRLRAVGSGHSWSDVAVPWASVSSTVGGDAVDPEHKGGSKGGKVILDSLAGAVAVDAQRGLFTVRGGTTLWELVGLMRGHGYALHNLPSVLEQTVAGAIATGTHGTGLTTGNLAEAVVSLEIVNGLGQVRRVSEGTEGDLLNAVRCNLGALGIVTEVTFRGVRAYNVREVQRAMEFEDFAAGLDGIVRGHDNVKAWLEPHSGMVNVFTMNRTDEPVTDTFLTVPLIEAKTFGLELVQHVTNWIPGSIPAAFNFLFRTLGAWTGSERVALPENVYRIPHRIARHGEMEIVIPYSNVTTPAKLRSLFEEIRSNHAVGHILEIRFAKGDKQWISMGQGEGPSCYITLCIMHGRGSDAVEEYFKMGEKVLDGRPHWAKTFYREGKAVTGKYPKWNEWNALRKRWDPKGIFLNAYMERLLK